MAKLDIILNASGRWTEEEKCYMCETFRPILELDRTTHPSKTRSYVDDWGLAYVRGHPVLICPLCKEILKY